MARGVLSGFITGGVVSTAAVALISVIAGPPKPPQAPEIASAAPVVDNATDAASGNPAANQVVASGDSVTATPDAPVVNAPEPEAGVQVPEANAPTGGLPEASTNVGGLEDPATSADQGGVQVGSVEPVYPNPQARAPEAPAPETTTGVSEDTTTSPGVSEPVNVTPELDSASVPSAPDASEVPAPQAPATVTAEGTPQTTPGALNQPTAPAAPVVSSEPAAPLEPTPAPEPETTQTAEGDTPAPQDENGADVPTPETSIAESETDDTETTVAMAVPTERVSIGTPATSLLDRDAEPDTDAEPVVQTDDSATQNGTDAAGGDGVQQPALSQFAVAFENEDQRPLMSIVLMDGGESLSDGPVGLEALQSFPYRLSFAVDASLPDAAERAEIYRSRGLEVLALVDLPANLTAADTEVALSAALNAVPGAVAVLEGPGDGLQGSREMSDQVTEILNDTGHGIIWQPKGLDTAQKLAEREGIASATLFRDFDIDNQTPRTIRRFLDKAAFKAGQNGSVVMVGRVRPDTISALVVWGLQDRAARVAVAPVSAVLQEALANQ